MKIYKVEEDELKYLIECRARLEALESGGVDNWSWYGESYGDYLQDMKKQYNLELDDDLDFTDIADIEIKKFEEG